MTITDTTTPLTAEEVAARLDWRGRSGEIVPGPDAARHLDATLALLDQNGWSRTLTLTLSSGSSQDDTDTGPLAGADESWSVKRLLLGLVRAVAGETSWTPPPPTLDQALSQVARTADGDDDTEVVADRCITAVLQMWTGAPYPSLLAWAGRRGRTYEQVRDLLTEAAAFARQHGPAAS